LITTWDNWNRLGIVIWNDLIRLWWIALILCVVLIDLILGILWYCWVCLVGSWRGIIVRSMARGGVLTVV
jgi:hypothetical protein